MPNVPQAGPEGLVFLGGPADGQVVTGPGVGPAPPGPPGAPPGLDAGGLPPELQAALEQEQPSGEIDWGSIPEAKHFSSLIEGVRALSGKLDSEKNKLRLEKVTTLLQEIRAADEQEEDQMMRGTMSPRMARRVYGAQGGGPTGRVA